MSRYVTVKYLTPVFAEVDLDAEKGEDGWYPDGVVRVQHGDSEVHRVDDDLMNWLNNYIDINVPIGVSYSSWADETPSPNELSLDEWAKAIEIAENAEWPAWEGY